MTGTIYFVSGPGRIKVGYTTKPEIRLAQLQAVDMDDLTTLGTIPGSRRLEKHIHELIKSHRRRGEWFHDCDAVRAIVTEALAGRVTVKDDRPEIEALPAYDYDLSDIAQAPAHVIGRCMEQCEQLIAEMSDRKARGERVSDLSRFACFLAEDVLAPLLHGPAAVAKAKQDSLRGLDSSGNSGADR